MNIDFTPGEYIVFEEGEYSDKMSYPPLEVMRPFNGDAVVKEYREQTEVPTIHGFIAWMATNLYVMDLPAPVYSWYLGAYGQFDA